MIPECKWKTIERPGWFGTDRASIIQGFNKKYGEGEWRVRHQFGPRVLDLSEALRLYELSYEMHFLNPDTNHLWRRLFKEAREVWTEEETDVDCGMDYFKQNSPAVHYEDMAIRIIMDRHGFRFSGDKLMRIRADSDDAVGVALSSIHISFVFPQYIEAPFAEIYWWNRHKGSLEDFWHTNKILQVRA